MEYKKRDYAIYKNIAILLISLVVQYFIVSFYVKNLYNLHDLRYGTSFLGIGLLFSFVFELIIWLYFLYSLLYKSKHLRRYINKNRSDNSVGEYIDEFEIIYNEKIFLRILVLFTIKIITLLITILLAYYISNIF